MPLSIDQRRSLFESGRFTRAQAETLLRLITAMQTESGGGSFVSTIEASESLAAGDFVNVHAGPLCRLANASTAAAARMTVGFVLESVVLGGMATIYHGGINNQFTGLTPGAAYALSHTSPGGVVIMSLATYTAGHILQTIGTAVSATAIDVEIDQPVERA